MRHLLRPCLLGLSWIIALGAGPPEVVKVRVPASKVAQWFPAGSDLQVLPPDRLDELVRSASERPERLGAPRILRATHSARWESGLLSGTTDLEIEAPSGDDAPLVILNPWSPALTGSGLGPKFARVTSDGLLALRIPKAGDTGVHLDWQLRARPGSGGRAFALAVPLVVPSALTLDLPVDLMPEGVSGAWIGPEPSETSGRATWRCAAAKGSIALRLRELSRPGEEDRSPRIFLEGPTRIDLRTSPANWKAEWILDDLPGAPRQFTIELDPDLDLIDVTGPRVASFRAEVGGPPARVTIRLEGEGTGPSPVIIRALCHPPAEGNWPIPSARAVGATWLGGRTTVRLDPGRVLQSCIERAGRRVPPRGDASEVGSLVFEPTGNPGRVAELILRKPTADATVTVRGFLKVGEDLPRMDAKLTWAVEKGRLLVLAADLPPGWTPDRVLSELGESVPWHADPLNNGGLRVQVSPAGPDVDARSHRLTIQASARRAGASGSIELPRVRPSPGSGRVMDEVWVAASTPSVAFRPTLARGLAWIDLPEPSREAGLSPWAGEDLAGALAWRWLVDDAEARAERVPVSQVRRAEVRLDASARGGRLHLEWTLTTEAKGGRPAAIPIHLDPAVEVPLHWRATAPGGPAVEARPIEDLRRAALGFPATGAAYELEVAGGSPGRLDLKANADLPWTGSGRIPLMRFPSSYATQGVVTIREDESARLIARQSGLTPIDPSESSPEGDLPIEGARGNSRSRMFAYRQPGGRLEVEAIPADPKSSGVIQQACLTSHVSPGIGLRHRLVLRIAAESAASILLRMPQGVALDRIRKDGQPATAIPEGDGLRIAVGGSGTGRSSTTLALDYRTDPGGNARVLQPSATLPSASFPCLGFVWEIVTPKPWAIRGCVGGLTETDPRPESSWLAKAFGVLSHPASYGNRRGLKSGDPANRPDLDRMLATQPEGEVSLGGFLVKLDSGGRPIVVDRLALLSAGWGPASRLTLPAIATRTTGAFDAMLRSMGLVAVPEEGVLLITTGDASPGRPAGLAPSAAAWSRVLADASGGGADESDRFQSAARWMEELTPRAVSPGESPDRIPRPSGWRAWRMVDAGWPATEASATLVDERSNAAFGWLVAVMTLVVGIGLRRRPPRSRALALGLAIFAVAVATAGSWPAPADWLTGLARGLVAVATFWLGRSFRPLAGRASREEGVPSTMRRLWFPPPIGTGLVILFVAGLGTIAPTAQVAVERPILALFPFEGPLDPAAKSDRVVMLLGDYERLRRLAEPEKATKGRVSSLTAIDHQVSRTEPGLATVETRCEIEVGAGEGGAGWTIPVGKGRDLSAEVDGRSSSLTFSLDGQFANVALEGAGVHRVLVRRSVPLLASGPAGDRLRLPVNRAAFARAEIASEATGRWIDLASSAGMIEVKPGGIAATIGPVDVLEVRWFPEDRPKAGAPREAVEATMLWDATPAGDLLRVRLTHVDPEGSSTIRLAPEPGLILRGYAIPDLVGIRLEGTAERPEWVAHVDPPWPRDLPIEVEFWRPSSPGRDARRMPKIEMPEAHRFAGVVGLRRPGDWTGRIEAGDGAEFLPDSSFARAWGTFPDDGLTLAGALRFGSPPDLAVTLGPVPPSRTIRPRVIVEVEPGRLNTTIEAVVSDRQGRSFEVELGLPVDFRVLRVEALGMLDWRRVGRDRLRVQLDGTDAADRRVRILGFVPAPADPALVEGRSYQAPIPWPTWADAVVEPGVLVVAGSHKPPKDWGEGVSIVPATPVEPGSLPRISYRVERPSGLGPIRWDSPKARVGVSVRSDVVIDPEFATWEARIDCDIGGGPCESLQWNLPTEWAGAAELEVDGHTNRPVVEIKGETTTWKIAPAAPLWGRSKMMIRSKLPLRPGVVFGFPDVSPMALPGRGSVGRYELAIANLSGRPLEVAGSPGLQAIDASRLQDDGLATFRGSISRAFRVTGDRWSLRIKLGGEDDVREGQSESSSKRVARARLFGSLGSSGGFSGLASYDLRPSPGAGFRFRLTEVIEVPWAAVDGSPVHAISEGPGRWLIPIQARDARRVEVCWHGGPPSAASGSGRGTVAWPSIDDPSVPTLMTWSAPRSIALHALSDEWKPIDRSEALLVLAEQIASRIVEAFSNFDRRSSRFRSEVVREVEAFELADRSFGRASSLASAAASAALERLRSARASIDEASQLAGLEDVVQEARTRIGAESSLAEQDAASRVDPTLPIRIRQVGDVHQHKRQAGSTRDAAAIGWSKNPEAYRWQAREAWIIGLSGALLGLASGGLVARSGRTPRRPWAAGIALAIAVLLVLEPLLVGSLLTVFGVGRALE